MAQSYEIGVAKTSGNQYIKCLRCNRESYNPNDIENKFCPKCGFHDIHQGELNYDEDPGYDPYNHASKKTPP